MEFREGELVFEFPEDWTVERLDMQGRPMPEGMQFVDCIAENQDRLIFIEVKDPSAASVPERGKNAARRELESGALINDRLVPKGRDSYTYVHLMERDSKPISYLVVLGLEDVPIDNALLLTLNDRLRRRLDQEAHEPWKRQYVAACAVMRTTDVARFNPPFQLRRAH